MNNVSYLIIQVTKTMLPTAKQFNKKYLEALKNIRLQLVQTSFLPNFLSNQVKSIHPLSFEGKFPPCNHAPLAYKRVHSLAAEFNSSLQQNIRTKPTHLLALFIIKLEESKFQETGMNLIIGNINITCLNSFCLVRFPMLCNVLRKWIVGVWGAKKCLDTIKPNITKLNTLMSSISNISSNKTHLLFSPHSGN